MIVCVRQYPIHIPMDQLKGILAEIRVPAGAELLDVFVRVEGSSIEVPGRSPHARSATPVLVYRVPDPEAVLLPRRMLFVPIDGDVTAPGDAPWRYVRLVKLTVGPTFALFESTLSKVEGEVIDAASMPSPKKLADTTS